MPEGVEREIIIVDDGSTDGSQVQLRRYHDHPAVKLHHSVINLGKGVAVRIGLHHAKGDICLIQDADLEYHPDQIPELIAPILENKTQVVFGSRFLGQPRGMVFLQKLGNRILSKATQVLFGHRITDAYTCYKVFTREVASKLRLRAHGFELEAELTAQMLLAGYSILELPIRYHARSHAEGKKIRARDGFKGLFWLAYYRFYGYRAPKPAG